jgi:hypothetical protein
VWGWWWRIGGGWRFEGGDELKEWIWTVRGRLCLEAPHPALFIETMTLSGQ